MQDKTKKGLIIAYIPIFIICLLLNCWLLYYSMFLKGSVSITTAYVNDATYSEDQTFFIDINYYSNENKNGQEMFEVRFNYYTDTGMPDKKEDGSYDTKTMYSAGVQFNGGYQYKQHVDTNGFTYGWRYNEMKNCYYYNSAFGESFTATNKLKDMDKWIFDISGDLCLIEEIGNVKEGKTLWATRGYIADTSLAIGSLYNTTKSLKDGHKVIVFDLSKFYNVFLYDEVTKQFPPDNTFNEKWTFINVNINKSSNGFIDASQSLFKCFAGDSNWSKDAKGKEEYWQTKTEYELKNNDFTFIFENNKYYLKLKSSCESYLLPFTSMDISASVDLDNFNFEGKQVEIAGFVKNAFGKLKISNVNLHSLKNRDFDLNGNTLNISSDSTITLIGGAA